MIGSVKKLACKLGVHGPNWGGYGVTNQSVRNAIVGPCHRRCKLCGAEWAGYEIETNRPYRVLAWERIR